MILLENEDKEKSEDSETDSEDEVLHFGAYLNQQQNNNLESDDEIQYLKKRVALFIRLSFALMGTSAIVLCITFGLRSTIDEKLAIANVHHNAVHTSSILSAILLILLFLGASAYTSLSTSQNRYGLYVIDNELEKHILKFLARAQGSSASIPNYTPYPKPTQAGDSCAKKVKINMVLNYAIVFFLPVLCAILLRAITYAIVNNVENQAISHILGFIFDLSDMLANKILYQECTASTFIPDSEFVTFDVCSTAIAATMILLAVTVALKIGMKGQEDAIKEMEEAIKYRAD